MDTKFDRREYVKFRKALKKSGFVSIQESVLIKLIHNHSFSGREILKVKSLAPKKGSVYAIPICISDFMELKSLSDKEFDFEFYTGNVIFL